MRFTTQIFDALRAYVTRQNAFRSQRHTMRAIAELPPHVLKDIGWPSPDNASQDQFR